MVLRSAIKRAATAPSTTRWSADKVMRSAISRLFREEADVRNLVRLKAVYELLETTTDKCHDVGKVIEGVVLENG